VTQQEVDLTDPESVVDTIRGAFDDPLTDVIAALPRLVVAVLVLALGLVLARLATRGLERALSRPSLDPSVRTLLRQVGRLTILLLVTLLTLAVAGVEVGAALAGLGIAGLAFAFAFQNILENFIAGMFILVRRPFRPGDQILTNDVEGTVEDIDLRVTRLVDYDGEVVLVPNADVFRTTLVNLTERGRRRTRLTIGVDYRDDHDVAREVIRTAVEGVDGVLAEPAVEVLLTELGESSVDFEVRYWTLPDIRSVRHTQDRVLSAAKRAIDEAGLTIPWPIRTLVVDPESRG
jgi:small conductance mechanosensitive channel